MSIDNYDVIVAVLTAQILLADFMSRAVLIARVVALLVVACFHARHDDGVGLPSR